MTETLGVIAMAEHVALLGDSIFDNNAYTAGAPDVVTHLRGILPPGWRASLLAVDGSTSRDLADQVAAVPADVTQLVISVGGNDALLNSDLLDSPVASTREAFLLLGARAARFEEDYRAAVACALTLGRRTTCCTIYNGNLGAHEAPVARVALMAFNDVILRVAREFGVDTIDLRLICTDPDDYANPIEPSGQGGQKIARAIYSTLVAS